MRHERVIAKIVNQSPNINHIPRFLAVRIIIASKKIFLAGSGPNLLYTVYAREIPSCEDGLT